MIFDWLEYLKFAEATLAKTSEFENSEAVYRSVTSRAYYAVYCLTRNTIKQKDRQEFFGSAHQQLQDYLIAHTHNVRSRLGRRLRALHQLRLRADYEDELGQQALSLAQQAVMQARKIEIDLTEIRGKGANK